MALCSTGVCAMRREQGPGGAKMLKILAKAILQITKGAILIAIAMIGLISTSVLVPNMQMLSLKYFGIYVIFILILAFFLVLYQLEKIKCSFDVKIKELQNHINDLNNMIVTQKLRLTGVQNKSSRAKRRSLVSPEP
jgi:hypothetical protein